MMGETTDDRTRAVLEEVKSALRDRYGARLAGLYLFGSRARGDHHEDSDIDLAVVLHAPRQPLALADRELIDIIYPIELDKGMVIQAWTLPVSALDGDRPDPYCGRLAATIKAEGKPV
jgi:uncharacterized protein